MSRTYRFVPHKRCLRRFHTRSEKRAWYSSLDQGFVPRKRRSPRQLPDEWDDHPISAHYEAVSNRLRRGAPMSFVGTIGDEGRDDGAINEALAQRFAGRVVNREELL